MEQSCYRCGAMVEEGAAFCPNCNAPQIRVSVPQPDSSLTPAPDEWNEAETSSSPEQQASGAALQNGSFSSAQGASLARAQAPPAVDWGQALPSAALAGAIIALAWSIPFVGFLVWMAATGIVAVLLYRRRVPDASPTPGQGARIGALAGLFGFGVFVVLLAAQMLLARGSGRFRALLQQVIQQAAAQNADPRAQELLERLTSPEGMALLLTLVLVMAFLAFLLFSSLGGALAASLLRKREP